MSEKHIKQISLKVFKEENEAMELIKAQEGFDNSNAIRFALIFTAENYSKTQEQTKQLKELTDKVEGFSENVKNTNWKINELYLMIDSFINSQNKKGG